MIGNRKKSLRRQERLIYPSSSEPNHSLSVRGQCWSRSQDPRPANVGVTMRRYLSSVG